VRYTGTPRPIRDKISAIVPWPTSSEKNSEISPKIDDVSRYAKMGSEKKVGAMRAFAPYMWSKVHPRALIGEKISSKKPNIDLAPMHIASHEGGMLRLSYDLNFGPHVQLHD